ncbi:trypsin II-P29 [Anabrus simplex]|uniref:trypsin II-P29 n=1 Tax=Anabrus simplex TaxID=316456 RepID=UPI0035A2B050
MATSTAITSVLLLVVAVTAQDSDWRHIAKQYTHVDVGPQRGSALRTVGGTPTKPDHFPHHVYIQVQNDSTRSYCSGAIISEKHVITAAHCTKGSQVTAIVAGVVNLADTKDRVVRRVAWSEYYPRFKEERIANDIVLLEVDKAFPKDSTGVQPIGVRDILGKPTDNCVVSGWVRSPVSKHFYLESMKVPLWPDRICTMIHPSQKQDTVCAGNAVNNGDNCMRDRSSILVCNGRLAGIANIDIPCNQADFPQSYTELAYYKDWLDRTMYNDIEFDTRSGSGFGSNDENDSED